MIGSEKLTKELEVLILSEELLNIVEFLDNPEKMSNFVAMQREFEERQLLQELIQDI